MLALLVCFLALVLFLGLAVVTGLDAGHRYAFRCSAINDQGSSGWGPVAQVDTLPGLPFPVDSLHLVAAASTSLKLRWSQPFGQGAAVGSYIVEVAQTAALQHQLQLQQQNGRQVEEGELPQENGHVPDQQAASPMDALFQPAYHGPDCACTGERGSCGCSSSRERQPTDSCHARLLCFATTPC